MPRQKKIPGLKESLKTKGSDKKMALQIQIARIYGRHTLNPDNLQPIHLASPPRTTTVSTCEDPRRAVFMDHTYKDSKPNKPDVVKGSPPQTPKSDTCDESQGAPFVDQPAAAGGTQLAQLECYYPGNIPPIVAVDDGNPRIVLMQPIYTDPRPDVPDIGPHLAQENEYRPYPGNLPQTLRISSASSQSAVPPPANPVPPPATPVPPPANPIPPPANPVPPWKVPPSFKDMEILKHQLLSTQRKLRKVQREHETLVSSLTSSFNADQIGYLKSPHSYVVWRRDTIKKALKLYHSCGRKGYAALIAEGFPLPSEMTVRRKLNNPTPQCPQVKQEEN